jgi:hypothetical protein
MMRQSEIAAAIAGAELRWVELAPNVEVMALPFRVNDEFVAVSARTAAACAEALTRDGWLCTLTTPKLEDMLYAQASLKPEPVLLNPGRINIASDAAIAEHSTRLLARIGQAPPDALVACGKSWVLSNALLKHPGKAANYGLYSSTGLYKSANGAFRLWQPLSFAHNLDHYDYSQMLRLVRRRLRAFDGNPAESRPPVESPEPPTAEVPPVATPHALGSLGERCLAWCLDELANQERPSAQRIAEYHGVAVRGGKPLGIKTGNHCASAQSLAMVECLVVDDVKPHEPRAAAIELQNDAKARGRWRPIADVRAGKWLPSPGDLAIYDRSAPGATWQRHVDRVIRVDGQLYENIGANETNAGAWKREWTPFTHPKLLGFIEYPAPPHPTLTTNLQPNDVG